MQALFMPYRRIVGFWKRWFPMVSIAHPSAGMGIKEKNTKRKAPKAYLGVQSPDSVRLRGPQSADPRRKNPAP